MSKPTQPKGVNQMRKPIQSMNYDGSMMRLMDSITRRCMYAGETVSTVRGAEAQLLSGTAPHKPSSTGFVSTNMGMYYPSVFGLHWEIVPDL